MDTFYKNSWLQLNDSCNRKCDEIAAFQNGGGGNIGNASQDSFLTALTDTPSLVSGNEEFTWLKLLQECIESHLQRGRAGQTSSQWDTAGYHHPETWDRRSWNVPRKEKIHFNNTFTTWREKKQVIIRIMRWFQSSVQEMFICLPL